MVIRRIAIESRTAELAKQFHAAHGANPPTSRPSPWPSRPPWKPATPNTSRARWPSNATPGAPKPSKSSAGKELHRMLGHPVDPAPPLGATPTTPGSPPRRQVIATVAKSRATWQRHHVLAEAQRVVRAAGTPPIPHWPTRITDAALSEPCRCPTSARGDAEMGEPARCVAATAPASTRRHGATTYTCPEVLAAERRIVAAAQRRRPHGQRRRHRTGLRRLRRPRQPLNAGQVALVRDMASSGRRVALALAPAGTGKTTAMAALSHAWRSSGGTIIGLAPTATAAIDSVKTFGRHRHRRQIRP